MPTNRPQPTLKDVAKLAGVSRTAASMALSGRMGSAHLSRQCIERVRTAAKSLGYRGNYHARTLSSGRSQTIGLAIGWGGMSLLEHGFFSPICGGVEVTTRLLGYDVLLVGGTDESSPLERAAQHLAVRRIDGIIAFRHMHFVMPDELHHPGVPLVMLEARDMPLIPGVLFDDVPGIVDAIDHLTKLGHKRIAWIGLEDENGLWLPSRYAAYAATIRSHGLEPILVKVHTMSNPSDDAPSTINRYRKALKSTELPEGVTAMLCHHDEMALAVLAHLNDLGVRVPEQVSLIGFDDRYAGFAQPELTTISHELRELGSACVRMLVELIDSKTPWEKPPLTLVPSRLVKRASTAPPPRR